MTNRDAIFLFFRVLFMIIICVISLISRYRYSSLRDIIGFALEMPSLILNFNFHLACHWIDHRIKAGWKCCYLLSIFTSDHEIAMFTKKRGDFKPNILTAFPALSKQRYLIWIANRLMVGPFITKNQRIWCDPPQIPMTEN